MMTSLERSYAGTATLHTPNPAVGHCQPILVSESPGHSWASLGQSLMGSLFLSLGSWCTQGLVVPLKSLFPWGFSVLWLDPQVGKSVVDPRIFVTV